MEQEDVTQLLGRMRTGDSASADQLFSILSAEMRRIAGSMMRQERPDHTLQPSAVVNEAVIRILRSTVLTDAQDRRDLMAAAVRAMKQVLIDHARARNALKRAGQQTRTSLDLMLDTLEQRDGVTISALNEALERLRVDSPRQAEALEMRFFSNLQIDEIAELMGVAIATVKRDLLAARAKLAEMLT